MFPETGGDRAGLLSARKIVTASVLSKVFDRDIIVKNIVINRYTKRTQCR